MLPKMFSDDFGSEITRLAILIDSHSNMFEVLVDKINDNVYFTRGWSAIRDFYDIRFGAWLILMYTGMGYFGLTVEDRLHRLISPPTFVPLARFIIDKSYVPGDFVDDLPESTDLLAYSHPAAFYCVDYEKTLTYYDVCTGFLVSSLLLCSINCCIYDHVYLNQILLFYFDRYCLTMVSVRMLLTRLLLL
jgi:hypothetical protein